MDQHGAPQGHSHLDLGASIRGQDVAVDEWSIATYGSPCRECGFSWSLTVEDAVDLVDSLPTEYREGCHHQYVRSS